MSESQSSFVNELLGGADVSVIPLESDRRMQNIPIEEMRRMYGKGFRLLEKSGLSGAEKISDAPIKVMLRRPREGLQDDDITGRKALGEDRPEIIRSEVRLEVQYRDLKLMIPSIRKFIDARGGSASVQLVINNLLKPTVRISRKQFLVVSRLVGLSDHGLKLNEDGTELLSLRPVSVREEINCACRKKFSSSFLYLEHLLKDFGASYHAQYENHLLEKEITTAACLECCNGQTRFPDIVQLINHCKSFGDAIHLKFAKAILVSQFGHLEETTGPLMLTALELGDRQFPWQSLLGEAADPLEDIPFDPGPPTPIHLEDDEESDCDVVEVVDIEPDNSNFINLED
jgi:hypothetical protein